MRSTTALPGASGRVGVVCALQTIAKMCKAAGRLQHLRLLQSTATHQVNGKGSEPLGPFAMLADRAAQTSFAELVRNRGELRASSIVRPQFREDRMRQVRNLRKSARQQRLRADPMPPTISATALRAFPACEDACSPQ